jgi:hypothetical protein
MILKTVKYNNDAKEIVITYKFLGITIYQIRLSTDYLRFRFRSIPL